MDDGKRSNSLCNVKVNILGERPLVAIGQKAMDRIRDKYICIFFFLFWLANEHFKVCAGVLQGRHIFVVQILEARLHFNTSGSSIF